MPRRHQLLAALVAAAWGLNFLAIDASLEHFPPMFLVALRFAIIAVPTLVLVPRPDVPVRWLIGYGLGFGILQFTFLYWGMAIGMPAGLASLVLQASGPFTLVLGATWLREHVSGRQIAGVVVAVAGLAVVGWEQARTAALLPFMLTLAGAFGWAIGNISNRQARAENPLHLTLWMSVVPPLPMLALALVVESPHAIVTSLTTFDDPGAVRALVGLAYTVLIGTLLGSGLWSWLMARHPASVVAPFSMLVPVVGMTAAWIVLGESVSVAELAGGALIVGGVVWGGSRRRIASPPTGRHAPAVVRHEAPVPPVRTMTRRFRSARRPASARPRTVRRRSPNVPAR